MKRRKLMTMKCPEYMRDRSWDAYHYRLAQQALRQGRLNLAISLGLRYQYQYQWADKLVAELGPIIDERAKKAQGLA